MILNHLELQETINCLPAGPLREKFELELERLNREYVRRQEAARKEHEADEQGICKFRIAWHGRCTNKSVDGQYCSKHLDRRCVVCGKQAIEECSNNEGAFVCGAPLCANHRHYTGGYHG